VGLKKVAVVQKVLGGRYSQVVPINLENWGSGWSFLTGGHSSEVVVGTGLTLLIDNCLGRGQSESI